MMINSPSDVSIETFWKEYLESGDEFVLQVMFDWLEEQGNPVALMRNETIGQWAPKLGLEVTGQIQMDYYIGEEIAETLKTTFYTVAGAKEFITHRAKPNDYTWVITAKSNKKRFPHSFMTKYQAVTHLAKLEAKITPEELHAVRCLHLDRSHLKRFEEYMEIENQF